MPPFALVATSRTLFRVDLETAEIDRVDEGHGLYFGITWDSGFFYVAARWYPPLRPTSAVERPRLLIFDSDLRRSERRRFPVPCGGLHQILFHEGRLICSCSREDSYILGLGEEWEVWHPSEDPDHHGRDVHHFNSVWIEGGRLFLLGHNNGPSDVWEFSLAERRLIRKYRAGLSAHNVFRHGERLAICSSGEGQIVTVGDGEALAKPGGFPRGIALGADLNVVGISSVANRSNRWWTPGKILLYDTAWKLEREIGLGLCGQVNDIRILGPDSAHHGLAPPGGTA
ncbi:MAG: hypothetical protein AAF725_25110 [Acidobacteriota bacterium]